MIKFKELRVHNGHLLISAEVRTLEKNIGGTIVNYYENVYISQIKIDNQDTFISTGPSDNLIYEGEVYAEGTKEITLDIDVTDLNPEFQSIDMNRTMFFVYAIAGGTPNPLTPCGLDNAVSLGVTFSLCPIYNETMQYVKEIENTCQLPKAFINKILQYKAIIYSINTGHYTQAAKYYKKFYSDINTHIKTPCNCHG